MAEGPVQKDSHFALGDGGGIELPAQYDNWRTRAAAQAHEAGGPRPGPGAGPTDSYSATFSPSAKAPRQRPLRDFADTPGSRADLREPHFTRSPYQSGGRGTLEDDPQRAYEHYAAVQSSSPAKIFDPRDDRSRMQTMQRFKASSNVHQTRFNPVLQQYANEDEERLAQAHEREVRDKHVARNMAHRQPELTSIRDLHEGELPPPPPRRGRTTMTITTGSDIFSTKPLPVRHGRKQTSSPYAYESTDWWNLNRQDAPPERDERINPYKREAIELNEKNRGTHIADVLSPARNDQLGDRLLREQAVDRARTQAPAGRAQVAAQMANAVNATNAILAQPMHRPSAPDDDAAAVADLSNIGHQPGRVQAAEFKPQKRTFGASPLRTRNDFDIISGTSLDGSQPSYHPAKRQVDAGMQAGAGVASSLVYVGGPAAPPPDASSYKLQGTRGGKKAFSAEHWGETGADIWKPDQGTFSFARY